MLQFRQLISHFLAKKGRSVNRVVWFHDFACAHSIRAVQTLFLSRMVGLGHTVDWSPKSYTLLLFCGVSKDIFKCLIILVYMIIFKGRDIRSSHAIYLTDNLK